MIQNTTDIDNIAGLFLKIRLKEHKAALENYQKELEENICNQKTVPGPITRGQLISDWTKAFESHCNQIVNDFINLTETFNAFYTVEFLRVKLDTHINVMAADFCRILAEKDHWGVLSSSAERKRVSNFVSSIKAQCIGSWKEKTQHLVAYENSRKFKSPPLVDLDDRLPVRRRSAFDRDLTESIKRALQMQEPLSLTMIDIDHFKQVNDLYGHPVGDEVLVEVSQSIVKRLAHKGKAYRYGGEEFALILPSYSVEEAVGLSERIRKDIEDIKIGTKDIKITASFGVACFPEDSKDPILLLKEADTALYVAKTMGRNCVRTSGK